MEMPSREILYLRFSYANSLESIREGMNRLESYLKEIM
jgi:hypothetical protein